MELKGKNIFVRAVPFHLVGEVVEESGETILLRGASWVADSGRFSKALAEGELSEVEKIPGEGLVAVYKTAICDIFLWEHELPKETK